MNIGQYWITAWKLKVHCSLLYLINSKQSCKHAPAFDIQTKKHTPCPLKEAHAIPIIMLEHKLYCRHQGTMMHVQKTQITDQITGINCP